MRALVLSELHGPLTYQQTLQQNNSIVIRVTRLTTLINHEEKCAVYNKHANILTVAALCTAPEAASGTRNRYFAESSVPSPASVTVPQTTKASVPGNGTLPAPTRMLQDLAGSAPL